MVASDETKKGKTEKHVPKILQNEDVKKRVSSPFTYFLYECSNVERFTDLSPGYDAQHTHHTMSRHTESKTLW